MKLLKPIISSYNKLSNFAKLLFFIIIFLLIVIFFKSINPTRESMTTNNGSERIVYKEGNDIYDEFYSDIYDKLVFNSTKNSFEIATIISKTNPTDLSIIADIGCGVGHQVKNLTDKKLKVVGIDVSPSMIQIAKEAYPSCNYQVGDALDNSLFKMNSISHILCLYFTIYYFNDKRHFFDNCIDWLMPGGYLIVHLVDRETFDPILPAGNPLYVVSPQKYAKERITNTKITFNDFVYQSNFILDKDSDIAVFDEKFKFHDGKVRKQKQKLYMEDTATIVNLAQNSGFILQGKVNMVNCAYENQYLYIFIKPS